MSPDGGNGDRRALLAVRFVGTSALLLTLGLIGTAWGHDTVPSGLAALAGTVYGYLAGIISRPLPPV